MRLMLRWRPIAAVLVACLALVIVMLSTTRASGGGEENCGSELVGSGSSLQAAAQNEVWSSGWSAKQCEKKPTVKYTATSSGLALEQWGANKGTLGGAAGVEKPFPMFIGTDIAPEGPATNGATQLFKMVKAAQWGESEYANEAITVPVAQLAVAVVVSLPKGCNAGSGTPEVKSKALEEEWEAGTVSFKTLITGVTLTGKSCEEVKKAEGSLQPLLQARSNASGASAAFKRYLALIGPAKNEFINLTPTAEKSASTEWPKTLPAGQPSKAFNSTDSDLAQTVATTAGSIGYVGLADAIAAGFKSKPEEIIGQGDHQSFFVQVQNNGKEAAEPEYASPESGSASNCSGAEYKEVPSTVEPEVDWSHVVDKNIEAGKKATYPICTLTFDVAWIWADMPELEGKRAYSEENDAAVYSYLRYIVATEAEAGGQNKTLEEKHYAKLPTEIQTAAGAGLGLRSEEAGEAAVKWPAELKEEEGGGPPNGPPVVVSLGDSYISGEAGRWAGNTNTTEARMDALGQGAYFDNAGHTGELVRLCHRSRSAEIYFGVLASNLACSGSKTSTFKEGNIEKPGLDEGREGVIGQTRILRELAEKHNVKMVVVSVGGNDFNFATIVERCVIDFLKSTVRNMRTCEADPLANANVAPAFVMARRGEITTGLENVKAAMTAAGYNNNNYTIVVQNYEATLPEGVAGNVVNEGFRYPQNRYRRQRIGGCGFWNSDANWANRTVLPVINNAVREGALNAGLGNLKLLNLTEAFEGRRLCQNTVSLIEEAGLPKWEAAGAVDMTEWVNMIRVIKSIPILRKAYFPHVFAQESFHPNYWGQLALRNCLRQVYNNGAPREGACKRIANGLVRGEPQMGLFMPVQVMSSGAGSAKGKGHTFSLGKATVKCEEATLQWKLIGQSPSLELTPEYGKCTAADTETEVSAKVVVKSCTYTLKEAEGNGVLQPWMALPKGCTIELAATFAAECKMKIEGPQEVEAVKVTNLNTIAGSYEAEIDPNAMGLAFKSEGTGCAGAGVPEEGYASYEGKTVGKGLIAEEPGTVYWHVRSAGESSEGTKAPEGAPVKLQSKGGETKIASKVSGEATTITCAESKGEGVLNNRSLGGQAKLLLSLEKCTTTLKHCVVAEPISIPANLNLTWKWDGTKGSLQQGKQQALGQKLGVLMTHKELEAGEPSAEDELTSVKMTKDGVGTCSTEGTPLALKGYEAADLEPQSIEQFSKEPKLKFTPGKHREHYWNGKEQKGVETTLKLGSEPAELTSSITLAPVRTATGEEQEAAIYES
jgi:ABC-type phosphate transport system substrate-binding protein